MICGACSDGGHDRCEQPSTCTCEHRPDARTIKPVSTLDELHEQRRAVMNADVPPPDDC